MMWAFPPGRVKPSPRIAQRPPGTACFHPAAPTCYNRRVIARVARAVTMFLLIDNDIVVRRADQALRLAAA
jgi:hypothetical protein